MAAYPGVQGCTKGLPPASLPWLVEYFLGSEKEPRKQVEQEPLAHMPCAVMALIPKSHVFQPGASH